LTGPTRRAIGINSIFGRAPRRKAEHGFGLGIAAPLA